MCVPSQSINQIQYKLFYGLTNMFHTSTQLTADMQPMFYKMSTDLKRTFYKKKSQQTYNSSFKSQKFQSFKNNGITDHISQTKMSTYNTRISKIKKKSSCNTH